MDTLRSSVPIQRAHTRKPGTRSPSGRCAGSYQSWNSSWAFEMETIIIGWYVMVHTGSVLQLTAFGAVQFLGTLMAPMFGVIGDRLGSRALLCGMRAIYAVLAALLTILAVSDVLTPAWV